MSTLEKTQAVVSEFRTSRNLETGGHINPIPRIDSSGIRLSEVPLDLTRHQLSDMNLFSITELATSVPQVQEFMPTKSMSVQIVEDRSAGVGDDPRISSLKTNLNGSLTEAVVDSKADPRDRIGYHLIDKPGNKSLLKFDYNFDVINFEDDPEAIAESISNICLKGLTFIISDFKGFDLSTKAKDRFRKTVAIKVNHQAEIYVPPGKYELSTPKGSVRAWKPKELDPHNDDLRDINRTIVGSLESVGIQVAQVILQPTSFLKFNINTTDTAIAEAMTRVKDAHA